MLLKIPIKKQKEKSWHCCVVCLQVVMEYFEKKVSLKELLKQIKVYKKIGTYEADEGKVALRYGFNAFFCHHNSWILNRATENLSEKDVKKFEKYLQKIKHNKSRGPIKKAREIRKDIEYIKRGGKFLTKVPTLELIDNYLKKRIPVIITLSNNSLRGEPDNKAGHCVVVMGKQGNDYIINDPLPAYPKPYKINKDKLLHAWYLSGAYVLAIFK